MQTGFKLHVFCGSVVQLSSVHFDGDKVKLKIRGLEAPAKVSGKIRNGRLRKEGDPGNGQLSGAPAGARRMEIDRGQAVGLC